MKNENYINELSDLVDDILFDTNTASPDFDIYEPSNQPKHMSWIQFYWSYGGIAGEYTWSLTYMDAEEFQEQLLKVTRLVFNPTTLQYIRDAKVTEFGMHIGPYQPSGGNTNDELGIEVIQEMKDRE